MDSPDAWFNLANFDKGFDKEYLIHREGNGAYVFVLNGQVKIGASGTEYP